MSGEFAAKLAELRRVYITSLPAKLDEVAAALERRDLDGARMLAHRLRGTAGSYGVAPVSDALAVVENRIDAASGETSPALWTELDGLLAAARQVILGLQ